MLFKVVFFLCFWCWFVYGSTPSSSPPLFKTQAAFRHQQGLFRRRGSPYAATIGNLGTVLAAVGEFHQAVELLEECLSIMLKDSGPQNTLTVGVMTTLGSVYRSLGRVDEALDMYEQAHGLTPLVFGKHTKQHAAACEALADLLSDPALHRHEDAVQLLQECVDVYKSLGMKHRHEYRVALHLLGGACCAAKQNDAAISAYERYLSAGSSPAPAAATLTSPQDAAALRTLAQLHRARGPPGFARARELLVQLTQLLGRRAGLRDGGSVPPADAPSSSSPAPLSPTGALRSVHSPRTASAAGTPRGAPRGPVTATSPPSALRAVAHPAPPASPASPTPWSPRREAAGLLEFAAVLTELAGLSQVESRREEAVSLLEEAVAVHEQVTGEDVPTPALLATLTKLGWAYASAQLPDAAAAMFQRCIDMLDAQDPTAPSVQLTNSLSSLAQLKKTAGKLDESVALMRRCVQAYDRMAGDGVPPSKLHLDAVETLLELDSTGVMDDEERDRLEAAAGTLRRQLGLSDARRPAF